VNPINGLMIDGPVRSGPSSFVAYYPEPVRYAMTEGELAAMCKAERHWDKLDLTVIKLEGWQRNQWFDQTGLPWINPSPNMRGWPRRCFIRASGCWRVAIFLSAAAQARLLKSSARPTSTISGWRRR